MLAETSNAGDPPCSLSVLSPSLGSYHRRGTGATPLARARPHPAAEPASSHSTLGREGPRLMGLMRACVRARARAYSRLGERRARGRAIPAEDAIGARAPNAFVALAISVNAERVGPGERRSAAAATASCSSCA